MSTDILTACLTRLQSFSYSPAPTILWPNVQSTPPATGLWLEPGYFPNEPIDDTWSQDCAETRGFFQILVGYRKGTGEISASELADAVVAWFPKTTALDGVVVRKRPTRGPAYVDEDKCFIPITIYFIGMT